MKKVELLSPAGGYETMVGAFNAGASAVYLGGSKFGARAYADNFDRDEVLDAIVYAHLHDKKIYMTVNTLVKESEFSQLYDFMLPYAEKKLDGVIVQDLGVARLIREEFPGIELHASTQQTVTGVYAAKLLKERGYTRVVPARELSLDEMRAIRQKAGIEVEAFIHGAMCYCYSGACLFSSVLGGRSGNRGRCAQPCRLPYRQGGGGKEIYPLSLKDMSTIGMIPELIEAGIDSFKIEGRMKRAEYSAGVTALYRKYIDRYYENPKAEYSVSKEDMEILRNLYQRTGISDGYYHRHNDKSMVTISSPAYNKTSDAILTDVHDRYLSGRLKHRCEIYCKLILGQKIRLAMTVYRGDEVVYEEILGSEVVAAAKRPMDEEMIRKHLGKLGNTSYEASSIDVSIDDGGTGSGIFVAVSELNELRRQLTDRMDERMMEFSSSNDEPSKIDLSGVTHFSDYGIYDRKEKERLTGDNSSARTRSKLQVLVSTQPQLSMVCDLFSSCSIQRVFVDSNVFLSMNDDLRERLKKASADNSVSLCVALPYITRQEHWDGTKEILDIAGTLSDCGFDGALVRNLEQLSILRDNGYRQGIILDYGVYVWNRESALEILDFNRPSEGFITGGICAPYELSFREVREVAGAVKEVADLPISYCVYGYLPMMVSAGCIKKTTSGCSGKLHELHTENTTLIDRMNNTLKVTCNCRSCYNIIWNALPTSLHRNLDRIIKEENLDSFRVDFSVEDAGRCRQVLEYYDRRLKGLGAEDVFPEGSYTAGHFKRGAE